MTDFGNEMISMDEGVIVKLRPMSTMEIDLNSMSNIALENMLKHGTDLSVVFWMSPFKMELDKNCNVHIHMATEHGSTVSCLLKQEVWVPRFLGTTRKLVAVTCKDNVLLAMYTVEK